MAQAPPSRLLWLLCGAAAVLLAGLALFLLSHPNHGPVQHSLPSGFQERATEAGISWRMAFLPAEQGEKFKINLYDHGCGVAVGDYNGDGFDDIYFVNELGANALYKNHGDG